MMKNGLIILSVMTALSFSAFAQAEQEKGFYFAVSTGEAEFDYEKYGAFVDFFEEVRVGNENFILKTQKDPNDFYVIDNVRANEITSRGFVIGYNLGPSWSWEWQHRRTAGSYTMDNFVGNGATLETLQEFNSDKSEEDQVGALGADYSSDMDVVRMVFRTSGDLYFKAGAGLTFIDHRILFFYEEDNRQFPYFATDRSAYINVSAGLGYRLNENFSIDYEHLRVDEGLSTNNISLNFAL